MIQPDSNKVSTGWCKSNASHNIQRFTLGRERVVQPCDTLLLERSSKTFIFSCHLYYLLLSLKGGLIKNLSDTHNLLDRSFKPLFFSFIRMAGTSNIGHTHTLIYFLHFSSVFLWNFWEFGKEWYSIKNATIGSWNVYYSEAVIDTYFWYRRHTTIMKITARKNDAPKMKIVAPRILWNLPSGGRVSS